MNDLVSRVAGSCARLIGDICLEISPTRLVVLWTHEGVVLVSIITVHRKIAMNVVNRRARAYNYEDSSTFRTYKPGHLNILLALWRSSGFQQDRQNVGRRQRGASRFTNSSCDGMCPYAVSE